jgi:hypothetical protein|tara:strand:- start:276 stop:626 length:351 start_codon:yes stop_codon:yes gene_type:complete
MAHYAILDKDNVVTQVITGKDETDNTHNWEEYYGGKRTSYNTSGGVHSLGGTPFRKNYAGIGDTYDASKDAFIPPKPYDSWTLNEDTCNWDAPTARPTDNKIYGWNEGTKSWDELS